jgi:hypothetical protein
VTKYSKIINLKGGKVYFGSRFWRLKFIITWFYCFEPVVQNSWQKHMVMEAYSPYSSHRAKTEEWSKIPIYPSWAWNKSIGTWA